VFHVLKDKRKDFNILLGVDHQTILIAKTPGLSIRLFENTGGAKFAVQRGPLAATFRQIYVVK
jgi:hypothetical protein